MAIHNVLIQKELGEKRSHWMIALQEYDLEIKPTKIIRGQSLCQLTVQSIDHEQQHTDWEWEEAIPTGFVNILETTISKWYDQIKFFLHNGFSLETLDPKKCRVLRLKSTPYQLTDNVLFRNNYDGIFLRCLEKDQTNDFLFQFHVGPAGGHFSAIQWLTKLSGQDTTGLPYSKMPMHLSENVSLSRSALAKWRNLLILCNQ